LSLAADLASLPRDEVRRLLRAAARRKSLLRYVQDTTPGYLAGWFHADLCTHLEQWSEAIRAKQGYNLAVFAPPRHGKSQIVSRRLPVWHLGHDPTAEFILGTYGQDLANDLSRDALACLLEPLTAEAFPDLAVSAKRAAVEQWRTTAGGGLSAVGVGGALTGRGGNLIIDDPTKGAVEASSAHYRELQKQWWIGTARTRVPPGGGKLVTATRWHTDDLPGWLAEGNSGEVWRVVSYPAIAEFDDDHRKTGEALHPDRWPVAELAKFQSDPYSWSALFQQRPVPAKGHIIRAEWLRKTYTEADLPKRPTRRIMSIDSAYKEAQINDPSAIVVADHENGNIYIRHVWTGRKVSPDLELEIESACKTWNPNTVLFEDKGSGQDLIPRLKRKPGWRWPIVPVTPRGTKQLRMSAESGWLAAGNVYLPVSAPWLADFLHELLTFPKGAHDDQVDALSQLLAHIGRPNLLALCS